MDDVIGVLDTGRFADISIFAGHGKDPYRAVIEAEPKDVSLVMRGGKVLYGDDATVGALAMQCDAVDVCGKAKQVCVMTELNKTYGGLKTDAKNIYPAFACGVPDNEPSCAPARPTSVAGSTVYTGVTSATDSDGDGVPDATDNCPTVFNPIRPLDGGKQADYDKDGVGDACDPCPLDANTTTCKPVDRDGDGVADVMDNCPEVANTDQKDADGDGVGDACDVCPNDANPNFAGCPTTIYKINDGTTPVGIRVSIKNALVTARGTNGFFVQVKPGDEGYTTPENSGLFVFTSSVPAATITVGSRVSVEGDLQDFFTQLELSNSPVVTVTSTTTEAAPAPVVVAYADVKTGGPKALAFDGVLVTVGAGSVASVNATNKDFLLSDGTSSIIVDGFVSPLVLPAVGQGYSSVTGILVLKGEKNGAATTTESKIEPRGPTDLATTLGVAAFGPVGQFARVAAVPVAAPTFPQALTITLSGPAPVGGATVALTSSDPTSLTVDATLIVAAGTNTVAVPVTALKAAADVTLTATLGSSTQAVHVRVLDINEGPTKLTLSPKTSTIASGAAVTLTATLDLPALTAQTVTIAANPTAAGTFSAGTFDIAIGQLSGTFVYTDAAADTTATTTITATSPVGTDTATVTVTTTTGGADHLLINEADYDQAVNPDSAEFVELYNPTDSPIALAGKALLLVNGATTPNGVVYGTIDLGTATTKGGGGLAMLPSHGYLVIAGATFVATLPDGAAVVVTPWKTDGVQNGGAANSSNSPDGLAVIDSTAHTLIDALSYEGPITSVTPAGFAAAISLVQSDTPAASIFDPGDGSVCRSPDGGAYKVCAASTPGAAN